MMRVQSRLGEDGMEEKMILGWKAGLTGKRINELEFFQLIETNRLIPRDSVATED